MTPNVRLSELEIATIKKVILGLDREASIYLFGSRVDLTQHGGDIDLLILSQVLTPNDTLDIRYTLFQTIDEQKIDILITKDESDPFVKIALESGKRL